MNKSCLSGKIHENGSSIPFPETKTAFAHLDDQGAVIAQHSDQSTGDDPEFAQAGGQKRGSRDSGNDARFSWV